MSKENQPRRGELVRLTRVERNGETYSESWRFTGVHWHMIAASDGDTDSYSLGDDSFDSYSLCFDLRQTVNE